MKNFALKIIRKNFVDLAVSSSIRKLSRELLLDIIADISVLFPANSDSLVNTSNNYTNVSSHSSSPHSVTSSPITCNNNNNNNNTLSSNSAFFNSSFNTS